MGQDARLAFSFLRMWSNECLDRPLLRVRRSRPLGGGADTIRSAKHLEPNAKYCVGSDCCGRYGLERLYDPSPSLQDALPVAKYLFFG